MNWSLNIPAGHAVCIRMGVDTSHLAPRIRVTNGSSDKGQTFLPEETSDRWGRQSMAGVTMQCCMNLVMAETLTPEPPRTSPGDARVFTRVPLEQVVHWRHLDGDEGLAQTRNVSRGGMCIELGRYLRPGRLLTVSFDGIVYGQEAVSLPTRIAWCKPIQETDRYLVGLEIVDDRLATLAAASEVFYTALAGYGAGMRADCLSEGQSDNPSLAS